MYKHRNITPILPKTISISKFHIILNSSLSYNNKTLCKRNIRFISLILSFFAEFELKNINKLSLNLKNIFTSYIKHTHNFYSINLS